MRQTLSVMLVTAVVVLGLGTPGYTDDNDDNDDNGVKGTITIRSSWVPNVGQLAEDEQPLGDLWTFECPEGGTVSARVDTKDDTDTGVSDIDPILEVLDGKGNVLAFADDNVDCTYPPECGFQCPEVTSVPCGRGDSHSLLVRDFGTASITDIQCAKGGGYALTVTVFDHKGNPVAAKKVELGGGAEREVPEWAVEEGKAPVGPALDDENVPLRSETTKK